MFVLLFFLASCSTPTTKNQSDYSAEFKKICVEGSGNGRIELLTTKHTFSYESQIDKKGNKFDLVLDFPVIGEREIALSLDPEIVNRSIKNSDITELLKEQLGERADKARIAKSIEEFFVFASDFMRFKAASIFPKHYQASFIDGHFIMERSTPSYRFVVDNFVPNQNFYERVLFKIYIKELSADPILTLFLIPKECDM